MTRKFRNSGKANSDITDYLEAPEAEIVNDPVAGIIGQFEDNNMLHPAEPPDTNIEIFIILKDLSDEVKELVLIPRELRNLKQESSL